MEIRGIDDVVANWVVPARPKAITLDGQYAQLEPLSSAKHAASIHRLNTAGDSIWDYLPYGPFSSAQGYGDWVRSIEARDDPVFLAIQDKDKKAWAGVASFLRIDPEMGVIEVGHINYSPALQRRRAATEAMYLMMKWAFEAGYRRYEWKCNASNIPSCRAAERFGFSYEGIFRQAAIVKGRNRDTAWFAVIDSEWPALERAYQTWLSPDNFASNGQQKSSLRNLTAPVIVARDPRSAP